LDNAFAISLQLVNVRFASVENRVALRWDGSAGRLPDVLAAATELLVIPAKQRKPGTVRLLNLPANAVVAIDGEARGAGPVTVEGLAVGVHQLRVETPGFERLDMPIIARHARVDALPISLTEKQSKPFYTQWWFWTPIAALAAGGAA